MSRLNPMFPRHISSAPSIQPTPSPAAATTPRQQDTIERLTLENSLLRASLEVRAAIHQQTNEQTSLRPLKRLLRSVRRNRVEKGPPFEWNAAKDQRYSHKLPGFEHVLHIFNKQWLGIRAAAGSLPGCKLALDASHTLTKEEILSIIQNCDTHRVSRFVFHGMSDPIAQLIERISSSGLSSRMFLVYHGSAVQWCYEPEQKLAFRALEFARAGSIKRIHFLKAGHESLVANSYKPLLLNMAPKTEVRSARATSRSVLVPGSEGWIKNLHCNALGAAMTAGIDRVLHFSPSILLPASYARKLQHTPHIDRDATIRLMSCCSATLNVSLTECHPMVSLESEAVGTPCLRNPLLLDAHEDHPYVRLVEVSSPANPHEISRVLDRILTVPADETDEMIADYLERVKSTSADRYAEFLEL